MNTYNGWTNYATWRVNLEMFDGLELGDITFLADVTLTDAYELSLLCKEYAEFILTENTEAGLALDYALAFINDVNWHEIAEHLINDGE